MSKQESSSTPFTLRWRRPGGETFDMPHEYREGTGQTFTNYLTLCINEGLRSELEFVGRVVGSQIRCPLWAAGYHQAVHRDDKGQMILTDDEGKAELWVRNDDFAGYVIESYDTGYEFARSLPPVEALALERRWKGIDPDEDAAAGLDGIEREVENPPHMRTPPEARPDEAPAYGPEDIEREARALAERTGAEINEETWPLLVERASRKLAARHRAPTLNVPPLNHDQIQAVPVLVRDPESGEMKVTHEYHNLHAPDGETITRRMLPDDHEEMARAIVVAVEDEVSRPGLVTLVSNRVAAGQIWDWDDIEKRARAHVPSDPGGGVVKYARALDDIEAVCVVMAQEQDNAPQHGWTVTLPNVHLYNPLVDELAFCEEKDPALWILPIRFIQCGPVPFGPMCPGCIEALGKMGEGDARLVAPEELPEDEMPEDMVQSGGLPPFFYKCGGCGHYHPLKWAGDCRNDSMRLTGQALDERYGPEGWVVADETTGEPDPEATEGWVVKPSGQPDAEGLSVVAEVPWATYDTADPVYDIVLTHKTPGWSEASVRGILSALAETGVLDKEQWPGERVVSEAKRIYDKWSAQGGPTVEEYFGAKPEPMEFHEHVGRLIAAELHERYSSDPALMVEAIEKYIVPRVKGTVSTAYVLWYFIEQAARNTLKWKPGGREMLDIIPWVIERLDPTRTPSFTVPAASDPEPTWQTHGCSVTGYSRWNFGGPMCDRPLHCAKYEEARAEWAARQDAKGGPDGEAEGTARD